MRKPLRSSMNEGDEANQEDEAETDRFTAVQNSAATLGNARQRRSNE
jgi:hypothetical protein